MDPEATLKEMRSFYRIILYRDGGDLNPENALRLAELAQAMDDWLKSGGHLPNDWDRLNWTKKGER